MAKDGVHTIPFEKLAEAREGERVAREEAARLAAEAEALRQQLATAQAPAASPAPTAAPAPAGEKVSFGDYSDDAITQGVEKVAAQAVAKAVAPLQAELESLRGKLGEKEQQAVVDATTGHMTAIYTAHPDLDSILESREFAAWKGSLPAYAQPGVEQTLEAGTAQQVVELFNDFKKATGTTQAAATPSPAPSPAASAAARAAAAIAAAQTKTPTSLSEIPAGASAHVDEGSAMAAMTPEAALARFEKLNSPDQIEALLNRVI